MRVDGPPYRRLHSLRWPAHRPRAPTTIAARPSACARRPRRSPSNRMCACGSGSRRPSSNGVRTSCMGCGWWRTRHLRWAASWLRVVPSSLRAVTGAVTGAVRRPRIVAAAAATAVDRGGQTVAWRTGVAHGSSRLRQRRRFSRACGDRAPSCKLAATAGSSHTQADSWVT